MWSLIALANCFQEQKKLSFARRQPISVGSYRLVTYACSVNCVLDVLITRNGTRLSTLVHRKPTHTDRYLPLHSHHHPRMLTGVMQCMRNRAHQICEDTNKQKELDHLEEVFVANGYPVRTVKRTFSSTARSREKDTEEDPAKPMFVPYVRGVSTKRRKYVHH